MSSQVEPSFANVAAGARLYELLVSQLSPHHFAVRSFTGQERLSGWYRFDIDVTAPSTAAHAAEHRALGPRAAMVMRVGPEPRVVTGMIAAVDIVGRSRDHNRYRVRLVPTLWLLRLQRRSRIFQNMRADEIISAVLAEAGTECRWDLEHELPTRAYCTQYEETDYAFIRRLVAEHGLFFYYRQRSEALVRNLDALDHAVDGAAAGRLEASAEHLLDKGFDGETIVFADAASAYPSLSGGGAGDESVATRRRGPTGVASAAVRHPAPVAPHLRYLGMVGEGSRAPAHDQITEFELGQRVGTTSVTYREFDPSRPNAPLRASAAATPPTMETAHGGVEPAGGGRLEHYEHHGRYLFPDWDYGEGEPDRLLRQLRRKVTVARGAGHAPHLEAGRRFQLAEHPVEHLNREYVVISVEHRGSQTPTEAHHATYENRFRCVPHDTTYCLSRPKRRNVLNALTATVTSAAGDGIDSHGSGEIRVRFHWDREDHDDEYSSCWVRTVQAWGGAGWGTQFIPRAGMEVAVVFEGGDPDKPIVLGSLYNGTHPPPFALPHRKTRSGFRTQSCPGGGGYNELSFEDEQGHEQVLVRAQRDLAEEVLHDRTARVGNDETRSVVRCRYDAVGADASLQVGGQLEEAVGGDCRSSVAGSRRDTTAGDHDDQVSGQRITHVEGRRVLQVDGMATHKYAKDLTTEVTGSKTVVVGRHEANRSYCLHVEGTAQLSGTQRLEVNSDRELVLRCGDASIRLTADRIELDAPTVAIAGSGSRLQASDKGLELRSPAVLAQLLEELLVMRTDGGASFSLGREARLDGVKILLNSPSRAEDELPADPGVATVIELHDQLGQPLGNQRYVIRLEDGSELSGRLDAQGRSELELPMPGTVTFPDLSGVQPG